MDLSQFGDLARLVPELAMVMIFAWYTSKNNKEFTDSIQRQADMFMKLISDLETAARASALNEAELFRKELQSKTAAFQSIIETVAREGNKDIEALTVEIKTLTRWITFIAGRLGGSSLEELEKVARDEQQKRERR